MKSKPITTEEFDRLFEEGEESVLQFADKESLRRTNQAEHIRLREMMDKMGLGYQDIANITGHSYQSVKTMLQPNRELPRWIKLVLYVWEGNGKPDSP